MCLAVNNTDCTDAIGHSIKVVLPQPCGMQGTKPTHVARKLSRFIVDDVEYCYCYDVIF
jgi:hypothetical protein